MDSDTFREGVFALQTRRFGSVAEVMIERLLQYKKGVNQFHDLYDDKNNKRVEVKFSKVLKAAETRVTASTVFACLEESLSVNRFIPFKKWKSFKFDCNIQQIKKAEFDILYYGLFFFDKVIIFKIDSADITPKNVGYSDKQHKGNVGEGQFHINQDTLALHLKKYQYKCLTYEKLLDLLHADED